MFVYYWFCLEEGSTYVFGLNTKYQLGLGDNNSRYYPTKVLKDSTGGNLSNMKKIGCTYFGTFALDNQERIYSWGSGCLGHGNKETI